MNKILTVTVGVLVSMVITGAAAWLVFGQDKVTRGEMIDYVQNQSPWIVDRGEIRSNIRTNTSHVEKLGASIDKLVAAQRELLVEQRVLVSKFDQLVEENSRPHRNE